MVARTTTPNFARNTVVFGPADSGRSESLEWALTMP